MDERHVLIVGGGLAGLSAGCHARANGFRTTIVEHNLALGGVCTAWTRGEYTIDGCIHWLTGGPFQRLYEELGILPAVGLKPIDHFLRWRDAGAGLEIDLTRDLGAFAFALRAIAPEDAEEIDRLVGAAERFSTIEFPIDSPVELRTFRESMATIWSNRRQLGTLSHFRKPVGVWAREHLQSERLRGILTSIAPEEGPALVLLMMLGYLARGWLSRPIGGTARFRDALIERYFRMGGEARVHATVDEVLVRRGRAIGARLDDGTEIEADAVISTASLPETVLRLLGGRYGAKESRRRLEEWKLFQPIVLASFGVATPLADAPQMLLVQGIPPLEVGGFTNDRLYLRVCNDDPSFAPAGHAVVQAMLGTDYDWWATRGTRYNAEKENIAELAWSHIVEQLPDARDTRRMTDVVTPLTYWSMARSWRGAYEGWLPNEQSVFGRVPKIFSRLRGFYMAGQWVEPGGGVPTAVMSGRQAVQLLCAEEKREFAPARPDALAASDIGLPLS